ncbi:miaA, partial [Symbiodinium sp. KB8]
MEAKVGEGSPKVVFIIGSTGTGKSKLGIDICKKYGGEVINADAIQMYKGLDIATAKVTEVEMDGVPHHLLSFLEPLDESYTVREFRTDALALIDDITKRNRLPVVVGGTMYYVQALLRGALLDEEEEELGEPKSEGIPEALKEEAKANPGILYESLLKIDPIMAKKLHPNDLRRVERSLEVYYQFG